MITDYPLKSRTDDASRSQAESLWYETLPLLIKFLEDPSDEVAAAATPLLNDTMRLVSNREPAYDPADRIVSVQESTEGE